MSHVDRNKAIRIRNGNGKGKGKGKKRKTDPMSLAIPLEQSNQSDPTTDIREAVSAVVPEAAKLRSLQSTLVQEEWDVPVVPHQSLSKQDGIALVPRRDLADVIARVGFTAHKVAVLLTESPERLGLAGYHKERVRIRLLALNDDGERVETSVMRYLVQIGFGPHVQQVMQGSQADMFFTLRKMTGKMPEALGWPAGQKPAALVMTELTKHIPEEAICEVQTRHDGSSTFYLRADFVDTILRASGQGNFFIKESSPTTEFHLLWLDEELSLADALTMATDKDCFGVARKGGAARPKLALRFRNQEAMVAYAKSHGIRDTSQYGRWKITGVDITVGTYGLLRFVVYGIYGPSGARWEKPKRQYFHSMLQAIEHDRIERCQIPSIMAGDFNLELDDSYPLKQCLRSRF